MKNKDKIIKIVAIVIAIALVAFLAYFIYLQTLVARGELIKDNGQWFKKADWQELYGEYDTPAKNTPEEVYTKFRQALLAGDKETALGFIRAEKRKEHEKIFLDQELKDKYNKLPLAESIKKTEMQGNYASYSYFMNGEDIKIPFFIDFEKNQEGYWEIDSI